MKRKIFILSLQLIWKRKLSFLLLVFQIIVSSIIFIGMIGQVQMIVSSYSTANTFDNTKAYYFSPYAFNMDQNINIESIAREKLNKNVTTGTAYEVLLYDRNETQYYCYGYNDTLLSYVNFELIDGNTFENHKSTELMPIISIGNQYQVGEEFEFVDESNRLIAKGQVVGTISKENYIINFNSGSSIDFSSLMDIVSVPYADFVIPVNSQLYCSFDTEKYSDYTIKQNCELIFANNTNTDTVYDELCQYGSVSSINIMKDNYVNKINNELTTNGIILLVFTLLTLAGLGGINGIQSIENKKLYNIYYILGITSKKCSLIEAIRSFILMLLSFTLVLSLYYLTPLKELFNSYTYKIDWFTFFMTFIYIALIFLITSCGFIYKLSKENLISTYKENA